MDAHEPRILVETREELIYLLAEAAAIEHNLMCCYLYAAWSLRAGSGDGLPPETLATVRGWKRAVLSVAIEEMSHLTLAGNLTGAIGGAPHLSHPNFPILPGYHPSGVVVELAAFSPAVLDHFIYLERPEGQAAEDSAEFHHVPGMARDIRRGSLMPTAQDYLTVGHLYRSIRRGFHHLARVHGERALFAGRPEDQIGPADAGLPGLMTVSNLAEADAAIETIIEQGEGAPGHSENSHYNRFLKVRREYQALLDADPRFSPAFPVARNPVMRPRGEGHVHIDHAEAAHVLDLANAVYATMLRQMVQSYGRGDDAAGKRLMLGTAVELMEVLGPIAEQLARMPASRHHPGVHAGMTFSMLRDVARLPRGAEMRVLGERIEEIALHAQQLFPPGHGLAAVAPRLAALARRFGVAAPVVASPDPVPPPTTPESEDAGSATGIRTLDIGQERAAGRALTVTFRPRRCIHARFCVIDAPAVFRANTPGEWIFPDAMAGDALTRVVLSCPSGALSVERPDGTDPETAPEVNQMRLRENGPYAFHAPLTVAGEAAGFRATLCRCGASRHKPFCDGSHKEAGFTATGEPETRESAPLAHRDGPLDIAPEPNGPLVVTGSLEILSGTGRTINRVERVRLCRCGHSGSKPFCDGSHARVGFVAP